MPLASFPLISYPPPHPQALKEAFEVFCNKGVSANSSAELLATFCDNILKKGGSEKLSDEAIEDILEKVGRQAGRQAVTRPLRTHWRR